MNQINIINSHEQTRHKLRKYISAGPVGLLKKSSDLCISKQN